MARYCIYLDREKNIDKLDKLLAEIEENVQVRFRITGDCYNYGGIYVPELEAIICGHCGERIELDELSYLKTFDLWIDLTYEIIGDDDYDEDVVE
jgi:hypothetical protein